MTTPTSHPSVSSAGSSHWQAVLAAIAIAVWSLLIAAPAALLFLVLWAAVLAVAAAGLLDATGGMDLQGFHVAIDLIGAVIAFAAGVAFAGKLVELGRRRSSAAAMSSAPRAPWSFWHPFVGLGCVLLLVDLVLFPLAYAGVVKAPSSLRGAGVLGGAALLLILTACALFGAWWRATRALWAGARRSSFFAGILTACGLVVGVSACALASAVGVLFSALPPGGPSPGSAPLSSLRPSGDVVAPHARAR
ncbi:hypothetical protein [Sorangium sp. So ce1000]|uniref:hypothetical protein n=1 Tax=Sorangium sp. So ce1000 TaxID=3133325 RepID=UPI003F5DC292